MSVERARNGEGWVTRWREHGRQRSPLHSFASLLLAEGRQPLYVARQLGHSLAGLLSTYAHLIEEYEDAERVDAEREIARARAQDVRQECAGAPAEAAGRPRPAT